MVNRKPKTVQYRRRREGKTNYHKRLSTLLSRKPRLVLRMTNTQFIGQIIAFDPKGDKILASVDSSVIQKLGWNYSGKNYPAAYLVGLALGKKSLAAGIEEAIFDTGLRTPMKKGKMYSFLKGVLDAGMDIPHGDEAIFPDEDRISGKHIESYAASLKDNKELYEKRFAGYIKLKADPSKVSETFEQIKNKIMS